MTKVANLLKEKGNQVYSMSPDATVYDALKLMGEKNIGALPIIENEDLVGILSERDYARKVVLKGKASMTTAIHEIMTPNVITVTQENSIEDCMALMSNSRIRHLPVIENNKVIGMLSSGDILKVIIQQQKDMIEGLQSYITSG